MKEQLYKKMESMFHLIKHDYQEIGPVEMTLFQLARGNAFNIRVVGLEAIRKFRKEHPDCSITFKPTHPSEADFILLSLLFRENGMRVLTEGGSNLFIDHIDIFKDLLPGVIDPDLKDVMGNHNMSLARYLAERGAFKIFREPVTIKKSEEDGGDIKIGLKNIISLSRAYRFHLVEEREMYMTFPGYSRIKSGLLELFKKDEIKTGRSYNGKIDGFHHLPFQMDIEASMHTGVDVYIVSVNVAYAPVLEDENFAELVKLRDVGKDQDEIYQKDLSYIINAFHKNKVKGDMSIKFSAPVKIETTALKDGLVGMKIKKASQKIAKDMFEKVLLMQPIFPANVYFSAFDRKLSRMPVKRMIERINDKRTYLQTLLWGKEKKRVDLHYLLDYKNQIISADEIINRTFDKFNTPDKQITKRDRDTFLILRKDVAQQYRNHTDHFF